jgi:hypothetical protein
VIGINIFPNGATGNCPGKPVPGSRTTKRLKMLKSLLRSQNSSMPAHV